MARDAHKSQSPLPPEIGEGPGCLVRLAEGTLRGGVHENVAVTGGDYSKTDFRGLSLGAAVLTKVVARAARWRELLLADVRMEGCDLANLDCRGAGGDRVEICDSRLTGANVAEGRFHDLRIVRCKADSAWFIRSAFARACFDHCDLRSANFEGADLRGVVFRDCDLRHARFSSARLDGADLRGSLLEGIVAGPGDLRGTIIEPSQAAEVIALLGVVVARPVGDGRDGC